MEFLYKAGSNDSAFFYINVYIHFYESKYRYFYIYKKGGSNASNESARKT